MGRVASFGGIFGWGGRCAHEKSRGRGGEGQFFGCAGGCDFILGEKGYGRVRPMFRSSDPELKNKREKRRKAVGVREHRKRKMKGPLPPTEKNASNQANMKKKNAKFPPE